MSNSKNNYEQMSIGDVPVGNTVTTADDSSQIVKQPEQAAAIPSVWSDRDAFKNIWQMSNLLSKSVMVPEAYRNKPENCIIALDIASRIGWSPFAVMQNLIVVNGHPGWNGQASIAIVNGCGRFTPLQFEFFGNQGDLDWGCYAYAYRRDSGEKCVGPKVTWRMVEEEGWSKKAGSKWKTMPELMMRYRAGAFFARVHCPDAMQGIPTVDEVEDIYGAEAAPRQTIKVGVAKRADEAGEP